MYRRKCAQTRCDDTEFDSIELVLWFSPSDVSIPCAGTTNTDLRSLRLSRLSEEELQALEGTERESLETRVAVLRNIQLLLDSAVNQMNQYYAVTGK